MKINPKISTVLSYLRLYIQRMNATMRMKPMISIILLTPRL